MRKSKRELTRAVDGLDDPPAEQETVWDRLPDALSAFAHAVWLGLHRCFFDHPDTIVNAPREEAKAQYFAVVRERYGIDTDRDAAVIRGVEHTRADAADRGLGWKDVVMLAPASLLEREGEAITSPAGESIRALVEAGRTDEAERVLVEYTYRHFARVGDDLEGDS